jgi:hypothetical protein
VYLVPLNVTSPEVPSSDHDLPWLHIIYRLLLCPACSSGRRPVSYFCSDMLLLTSDWPRYHSRLDVPLADLRIHPLGQAPSTHLYTDFLCLLADPLGFEDPPQGTQAPYGIAAGWTSLQLRPFSYVVCALRSCLRHPSTFRYDTSIIYIPISSHLPCRLVAVADALLGMVEP